MIEDIRKALTELKAEADQVFHFRTHHSMRQINEAAGRIENALDEGRNRVAALALSGGAKDPVDAWLDEIENFSTRSERLADDLARGADIRPWLEAAFALGAASVLMPDVLPERETSPPPV